MSDEEGVVVVVVVVFNAGGVRPKASSKPPRGY